MSLVQQPLLIGAWIGLVHAFDADHISTLSSLAVRDRQRTAYGYAARWACGHAVAIGALGMLAIGLGMLWISGLSRIAELAVALVLVALGANTVLGARRRTGGARPAPHRGGSAAGLVMGLLHGGAGSAAVLALLPLAGFESGLAAFSFLATFSLGVATGALLFAALFSGLLARTLGRAERMASVFACLVGLTAAAVGAFMLFGVIDAG